MVGGEMATEACVHSLREYGSGVSYQIRDY